MYFDFGSAIIKPESEPVLHRFLAGGGAPAPSSRPRFASSDACPGAKSVS